LGAGGLGLLVKLVIVVLESILEKQQNSQEERG